MKHKPSDKSEELFVSGIFWQAAKLTTQLKAATTKKNLSIEFAIFAMNLFFYFTAENGTFYLWTCYQLNFGTCESNWISELNCNRRSTDKIEMLNRLASPSLLLIANRPKMRSISNANIQIWFVECFNSHFNWITTLIERKLDQLWREYRENNRETFFFGMHEPK